jgi:hypothetical protein
MNDRFTLHPKCLLTELDDGTGVVLHLDTKLYYTLNETGVFVWRMLDAAPLDRDALLERLTEEFEVEVERARTDLAGILDSLVTEGLARAE